MKVLENQVCKYHCPRGSDEVMIGGTVFTYVYIGKNISKIFL
jgi:hypothetical protein